MSVRVIRGRTVLIDEADAHILDDPRWCIHSKGTGYEYVVRSERSDAYVGGQRTVPLHRLILDAPDGFFVDHQDGNTLNNQRANLRLATHAENMQNRKRPRNNKSGYKGVSWVTRMSYWRAGIACNRKRYTQEGFATAEAAYRWYVAKAAELHGEFARFE